MWLEEEEEEEMPAEQVRRRMGRRAGYTVGKQKTKGNAESWEMSGGPEDWKCWV